MTSSKTPNQVTSPPITKQMDYDIMARHARNWIIGIVHIAVMMLITSIYPKLDDTVLLVSATLVAVVGLTCLFLYVSEDLTQKAAFVVHLLTLANIVFACQEIRVTGFAAGATIGYLSLSMLFIRIRPVGEEKGIAAASLQATFLANLAIWYGRSDSMDSSAHMELVAVQILLASVTIIYSKWQSDWRQLGLPFLFDLLIMPVLMSKESGSVDSFADMLFKYRLDVLWGLTGALLIIAFWIVWKHVSVMDRRYFAFGSVLVVVATFLLSTSLRVDGLGIASLTLFGNHFTMLGLVFVALMASLLCRGLTSEDALTTDMMLWSGLFLVNFFALLETTEWFDSGEPHVAPVLLIGGMIALGTIVVQRPDFGQNWMLIALSFSMTAFGFIAPSFTSVRQPLVCLTFCAYVFVLLVLPLLGRPKTESTVARAGAVLVLVILHCTIHWFKDWNAAQYPFVVAATLALGVLQMRSTRSTHRRQALVCQVVAMACLIFVEDRALTNWIDLSFLSVDLLSVALTFFVGQLLWLIVRDRDELEVMLIYAVLSSSLSLAIISLSLSFQAPAAGAVALLVMIPSATHIFSRNYQQQTIITAFQTAAILAFAVISDQGIGLYEGQPVTHLVSLLIIVHVAVLVGRSIIDEGQERLAELGAASLAVLVLMFSMMSYTSSTYAVPSYPLLGLGVLSLSLPVLKLRDGKTAGRTLALQGMAFIFLSFYDVAWARSAINKVASQLLENLPNALGEPFYSIVFLAFVLAVLMHQHIAGADDEFNKAGLFVLLGFSTLLALFSILSIGPDYIPSHVLVLAPLAVAATVSLSDKDTDGGICALVMLNVVLTMAQADCGYILDQDGSYSDLELFGVQLRALALPIVVFLLIWKGRETNRRVGLIMVGSQFMAMLVLMMSVTSPLAARIPFELYAVTILLLSWLMLDHEDERVVQITSIVQGVLLSLVLLLQDDFVSLGDILSKDLTVEAEGISYPIIGTLAFVVFAAMSVQKAREASENVALTIIGVMTGVVVVLSIDGSNSTVHQIILGLAGLSLSYLAYAKSEVRVKQFVAPAQALMVLALMFRPLELPLSLDWNAALVLIWAPLTLFVWYARGTTDQLLSSLASIFGVAGIVSVIYGSTNYFGDMANDDAAVTAYLLNASILVAVLSGVMLFTLVFRARLSSGDTSGLIVVFGTIQVALILFAVGIRCSIYDSNAAGITVLRLCTDWFVFVPLLVLARIMLKEYLPTSEIDGQDWKDRAFALPAIMMGSLTLTALLMAVDSIFVLKIMAIALVLWSFEATFTHKPFAWMTSVFTIFAFALGITAIEMESTTRLASVYLLLGFFGLLMTVASYVNETRGKGEPLTASLAFVGSIVCMFGVIMARLISPDAVVFEIFTSWMLTFLPNIVWMLLGLGLFLFSTSHRKSYLRRYSLGILMLTILLTGYDAIFKAGALVRAVAGIPLGASLIFIFYLVTKEEEENKL